MNLWAVAAVGPGCVQPEVTPSLVVQSMTSGTPQQAGAYQACWPEQWDLADRTNCLRATLPNAVQGNSKEAHLPVWPARWQT